MSRKGHVTLVSSAITQARAAADSARGSDMDDDLEGGDEVLAAEEALGSEEDGDAGTESGEPADSEEE